MAIFTAEDKRRIEARVAAAEQGTAAEIVVAAIGQSDSYLDVRLWSALLFGLGLSAAVHLMLPLVGVGELFALQIVLGSVGFLLSGVPALLRFLVPRGRETFAVARAAKLGFLEHAVFATRARTGVLILLSELEHNVTILGDEGIHAHVADAGWQKHVETIVRAIRAGKAADGVCEVIDALAEVLAQIAPREHDDQNELPDRVRD